MKRLNKVLVALVLAFFMANGAQVKAESIKSVFNKDEGLAKCIAINLKKELKDNVISDEIEGIRRLDCQSAGIERIDEIGKLKNLRYVNLSENDIKNIGYLTSLKLFEIDLSYNTNIEKLGELTYIKTLKDLKLDGINNPDLEDTIKGLTSLKSISVAKNGLTSAKSLTYCALLERIDISNNKLSALADLYVPAKLIELDASYNDIEEVGGLAKIVKIVNLSNNKISSINERISQSPDIEYLDISNNKLDNIEVIEKNIKIKFIDISSNDITSIDVLNDGFNDLEVLTLDYDKIRDVSKLNDNILVLYEKNKKDFSVKGLEDNMSTAPIENDTAKYLVLIPLAIIIVLIVVCSIIFTRRRSRRRAMKRKYSRINKEDVMMDIVDIVEVETKSPEEEAERNAIEQLKEAKLNEQKSLQSSLEKIENESNLKIDEKKSKNIEDETNVNDSTNLEELNNDETDIDSYEIDDSNDEENLDGNNMRASRGREHHSSLVKAKKESTTKKRRTPTRSRKIR